MRWGWGKHGGSDQVPPEAMTAAELDRLVSLLTDHNEWRDAAEIPERERRMQGG